jgi:hypothetical protein
MQQATGTQQAVGTQQAGGAQQPEGTQPAALLPVSQEVDIVLLLFFRIPTAEHRPLPNKQTEQAGKGRKEFRQSFPQRKFAGRIRRRGFDFRSYCYIRPSHATHILTARQLSARAWLQ